MDLLNPKAGDNLLKTLALLLFFAFIANSYALTEDYILYGHAEVVKLNKEKKKKKSQKEILCQQYAKTEMVKTSCLTSELSNQKIKACLDGAKSELSQEYCLLTQEISSTVIDTCQLSTTSVQSEIACLIIHERKDQEIVEESDITRCAGLGSLEEINCLKFNQ